LPGGARRACEQPPDVRLPASRRDRATRHRAAHCGAGAACARSRPPPRPPRAGVAGRDPPRADPAGLCRCRSGDGKARPADRCGRGRTLLPPDLRHDVIRRRRPQPRVRTGPSVRPRRISFPRTPVMPLLYARAPDITPRQVADSLFAAVPTTNTIRRLDPMAAAVWRALEDPRTLRELVELFVAAFPEVEREVLRRDLRAVLGRMRKVGLVVAERMSSAPRAPSS